MAKIKKVIIARQSVKYRLLGLLSFSTNFKGGRKAKNINLRITKLLNLSISLRKFKTNKHKRSKLHKQFVIQTYGLFYQEISFKFKLNKRRNKSTYYKVSLSSSRIILSALMVIGLAGILYFSLNLTTQKYLEPTVNAYNAPIQAQQKPIFLSRSEPTKLRIPKIEVNTSVISIGLRSDGTLDVPSEPDLVGWYTGSPTPGEIGPAVIDGHVDSPGGVAIFWRLGELQPGDIVEIDRVDSSTVKFRVDSVAQYPQDSFPTDKVYGNTTNAALRLITCSGTFDPSTRRYSHNTIVFGSFIP